MVENNDTKFPYITQQLRDDYPLTIESIDDWFKRCIEEYPRLDISKDAFKTEEKMVVEREVWFYKWFSQFRDKRDI